MTPRLTRTIIRAAGTLTTGLRWPGSTKAKKATHTLKMKRRSRKLDRFAPRLSLGPLQMVACLHRHKTLLPSSLSFGALWSIWDVRSKEGLDAWTQLNWTHKGRRRKPP
ncbi:unnamed protein product [Microthlaspi erraticum]|uniref:Uncharacterized protein n=1 Tax=Microthlaspi erraticum TaxID=1685480 RepID=A0A6D2JXS6_9BRAS|nr:unnamed protein product [Microthlaspi erraticum]